MFASITPQKWGHKVSDSDKEKDKQQWYKDHINGHMVFPDKSIQANYNMYENLIEADDIRHILNPRLAVKNYKPQIKFRNRDILSQKIAVLTGLDLSKPFEYQVLATNRDAVNSKNEARFAMVRDHAIQQVMMPIMEAIQAQMQREAAQEAQQQIEQVLQAHQQQAQQQQQQDASAAEEEDIEAEIDAAIAQQQGGDEQQEGMQEETGEEAVAQQGPDPQMLQEQYQQIYEQILAEKLKTFPQMIEAKTPIEVRQHMQTDFKLSAEVMYNRLLSFLKVHCNLKEKFAEGCFDAALVNRECYRIYTEGGHPQVEVCDMRKLSFDDTVDNIEDGEFAVYTKTYTSTSVIEIWGDELDDEQTKRISSSSRHEISHHVWKSFKKIRQVVIEGEVVEVDELYKLGEGDEVLSTSWILCTYEGYKIFSDLYVGLRPLYHLNGKLPYVGSIYERKIKNAPSIFDRGKPYQLLANMSFYDIEKMIASNRGKVAAFNINAIKTTEQAGSDVTNQGIASFMSSLEDRNVLMVDPTSELNPTNSIGNVVATLDLSNSRDIEYNANLFQLLDRLCSKAMGINEAILGQVSPYAPGASVEQQLQSGGQILERFFYRHLLIKQRVVLALLEEAKFSYFATQQVIQYQLDDLSLQYLEVDGDTLNSIDLGLHSPDFRKTDEIKQVMQALVGRLLQSPNVNPSTILRAAAEENPLLAQRVLEKEQLRIEQQEKEHQQQQQQQFQQELQARAEEAQRQREHEMQMLRIRHEMDMQLKTIGTNSQGPEMTVKDRLKEIELKIKGILADTEIKKVDGKIDTDQKRVSIAQQRIDLQAQNLRMKQGKK